MALARVIVVLALCGATRAFAAPPRSYVVDVTPAGDWRAEALATTLASDLADDRLVASARGPDLVVSIAIEDRVARYELRATWPGAPAPVSGNFTLGVGVDRAVIAARLRDQLHRLARSTRDDRAEVAVAPPSPMAVLLAIALAAVLVAAPFVVRRDRAALRHAAIWLALAGGAALILAFTGATATWLLAGGLAWGTFVAATVPVVFPPLTGFGRVEPDELWRVTGAWLAAVGRRLFGVTLLYAPIAIVTALVTDGVLGVALVVPVVLLTVRLAVRCAVAVIAVRLDGELLDRSPDAAAWELNTRAYVLGYLRRAGLPFDATLLRRVRVLPGIGDDVAVYGGGLTASRIVIPRKMLELALAPAGRPHDYAAPRVSVLHWAQWNAGLVMPTAPESVTSAASDVVLATTEQRRPREVTVEGEAVREQLGQPPTLAGVVEPSDLDVDHKSYRPHDDPMWLDFDSGEDYDGTDAGDRDFLFGAVIHALGEIQRHADRIATFALLLRGRSRRLASRPWVIGDHHAALAGARHHLAQYVGWQLWKREDLLTARAYAPELAAASERMLAQLPTLGDSLERSRLARLCDPSTRSRWQRFAFAGALVAAAGVASVAIVNAVRYHASYVAITKENPEHGKD